MQNLRRTPGTFAMIAMALMMTGFGYNSNAATRTWTGLGGDSQWSTAANWSGTAVPGAADDVVFGTTATVTLGSAATVATLTLDAGVDVNLTTNATLTVTGATLLGSGASIQLFGSAPTSLQFNGAVSFTAGGAGDFTEIYSASAPLKVVKFGAASSLSMGDLRFTYFGTNVEVWISRDTGFLTSSVRFNDNITIDAELNPGQYNIWLGENANILRSGYQNQNQNFISFSNSTSATGMVIKDIAFWMSGSSYDPNAGYFEWEVGEDKIAAVRVDVNYAKEDAGWLASATEPFRGVGVRTVQLPHPANPASTKYQFYWVVQAIGLLQDYGPGFSGYAGLPANNICYEVEFHPGYIQGSPHNVSSARYSNNYEEGTGSWYSDGSSSTSTNSSGRVFVPQCPAYGFGDITIGSGNDPVPVELTSFSARYLDGEVRLNWQTATETNNFGFAIERSRDGAEWEEVGFVPGAGTTYSPKSYTYNDRLSDDALRLPQLAYRLRQMDRDGTTEHSNIVFVQTGELPDNAELYAAYPNPFNPTTTISFAMKEAANVTLKVYNTFGQEVATLLANSAMDAGLHTVPFAGDALPSGVYMAVLDANGVQQYQKLVLNK